MKEPTPLDIAELPFLNVSSAQPHLVPPLLNQGVQHLSYQRIPSNSIHELLAGNDVHSMLAAGKHDICAAKVVQKSQATGPNKRDDNDVFFIS